VCFFGFIGVSFEFRTCYTGVEPEYPPLPEGQERKEKDNTTTTTSDGCKDYTKDNIKDNTKDNTQYNNSNMTGGGVVTRSGGNRNGGRLTPVSARRRRRAGTLGSPSAAVVTLRYERVKSDLR
jgi:hypothetical protein